MTRVSETTPLVDGQQGDAVPVVVKPYRYDFTDRMALDGHGVYNSSSFWFLNLGLLSCYMVCGLIIAALSTLRLLFCKLLYQLRNKIFL